MRNPYQQYNTIAQETLTGRELEAHVLTKAANKLKACQASWDAADRKQKLDEALKYNQKVWTFFQAELSANDNAMPMELRENLLNLSLFIDKHSVSIFAAPKKEKLDILININMNLASGLRGAK